MSCESRLNVQRAGAASVFQMRLWGVLLSLTLIIFIATAQALHFHVNEFSNHESCVVCQVAHSPKISAAAEFTGTVLVAAAFLKQAATPAPEPLLQPFSLFCRPPPAPSIQLADFCN